MKKVKVLYKGNKDYIKVESVDYDRLHSIDDKPAIIYNVGSKFWYKNGEVHRDNDKPAQILEDGSKLWHKNDQVHRVVGKPAMILSDGQTQYWIEGQRYSREDYFKHPLVKEYLKNESKK